MIKTAVVILNWNGLNYLKMFLATVVKHTLNEETAVYVADNGSTDESVEWVSNNFKEVTLIRSEKNRGFAGGYNMALKEINARYYVLLNSDIEVTDNWIEPLISFMDLNPDVASCQPKILSYKERDHFEHAGAAGGFIDKYGYPFCRGRIFSNIEKDTGQYDNITDVFWASGACTIVRSEAWRRCGGFDPDFFAHMEEIDLCWRFSKAGYRVSYIPESVVYHIGGGALPYKSPFKTYLNFRNSLFLLYKNLPENKLHSMLFKRKLMDGMAACFFLLNGSLRHVSSILKAHIDYYKALKHLRVKRNVVNKLGEHNSMPPVLNKSIVFEFYIKGKKTYSSLKKET